MKLSLLELVQNILSAMDAEEVNSISDNTESRQVAQIVRTAYFNIINRANLPEQYQPVSLTASGSDEQPVLMLRPDDVVKIDWIKYNKALEDQPDDYSYVTILPFQQFVDRMHSLNTDEDNVETMTLNDQTFYFTNDRMPSFCTVVSDVYFVFDSYDSEIESALESAKTICNGKVIPSFSITDAFIPELDDNQFPLLLNEAKSLAFLELKQMAHEQAIQESKRQWRALQKTKRLNNPTDFSELADFGRRC